MQDVPVNPLAIIPADYPLILSQSFGSSCGLTALLLILSEMPEKEATNIKEKMLGAWKGMWVANFQSSMSAYIADLSEYEDPHGEDEMPQPEEYQLGFNLALAAAEKSARQSLGLGESK